MTKSEDQSAKLWDVESGAQIFTFNFDSPVRYVDVFVGDKLVVITTGLLMGLTSTLILMTLSFLPVYV